MGKPAVADAILAAVECSNVYQNINDCLNDTHKVVGDIYRNPELLKGAA
jgi:hypothetical protein